MCLSCFLIARHGFRTKGWQRFSVLHAECATLIVVAGWRAVRDATEFDDAR